MKTANPIKFGTDGWRAVIAEEFTFDNVRICAQALSDYLKEAKLAEQGLVIGYDTRFASEDFAAACSEVVAGNGIKVYLNPQATPTPVISYGVVEKKAGGAIIITASHNPGRYNGFKVKSPDGASAPTEAIAQIEKHVARIYASGEVNKLTRREATAKGLIEDFDIAPAYCRRMAELVDLPSLKKAKLDVVVDSMFGAGIGYTRALLDGGAIKIHEINGERNPAFPGMHQPEPIAHNLTKLAETVKKERAGIGLATDGDADRVGIMDENGRFLNQLQVFALLALYMLEVRGERGAIVKTLTTTMMLDRLGALFKVPVFETAVGFKYVAPVMLRENAIIGGEESGGYGFRGHVPERDGILAGLYFLDFVVKTGKSPAQLLEYLYSKVGPHYYDRIDVTFEESQRQVILKRVKENAPQSVTGVKVIKLDTTDGFRFMLADNSWLLIRFSGTEPLLRIYAESSSTERVQQILEAGKILAGV